jgi:hypothetical protein
MKNSDLLKQSATYSHVHSTMRDYQLAYLGGMQFKRNVRKKRPSEDEKLYTDVVENTAAMPVSRYIVDTINDTVFSQPIYRDLEFCYPNGIEIDDELDWTELVEYDADLQNQSMDQFMAQVGEMSAVFGHCWVFVDMPSVEQGTSGRPYVALVSPLQVWDWHFTMINGRQIPQYIKVCEVETAHEYIFKCYHLGTTQSPSYWNTYRVNKSQHRDSEAELIDSGTFPPGMAIPGFIAYTRRDPRFVDLGVSDIDSASEVQREVYKLECEAYQAIQFARTLIRADAGVKVPAHAGGIVRATEGQIETLNVDTQDVTTIITKQDQLLDNLEGLIGLSGLRQNKKQSQSGVAIIQERKGLHKLAASKARELEVCEEYIWTFMARYMGVRWAGEVTYGTNYAETDTQLKIAKLDVANKLSGNNPVIKSIIDQQVLELLVDDSAEQKLYLDLMKSQSTVLPNGTVQPFIAVEEAEEKETETRDLGDQTPLVIEEYTDVMEPDGGIIDVGNTTYTPITDQLVAAATGR